MLMVLSALGIVGLLIWAVRTKKYSQSLFALAALAGIDACVIGAWICHQGGYWPGALLIAIGVASLLCNAIAVKRLYSSPDLPAA
jgi:hypothetical protein